MSYNELIEKEITRFKTIKTMIIEWDENNDVYSSMKDNSLVKTLMKEYEKSEYVNEYDRESFHLYTKSSILYALLDMYLNVITSINDEPSNESDPLMEPLIV